MRVGRGRRGLLDIVGYRVRVIGCSLARWPDMDGSWQGPRSGTSSSYDEGVDDTWPAGTGGPSAADVNGAVDARLEALLGAASGPVNWRSVASSAARQRWLELRDWVDWFRLEFASITASCRRAGTGTGRWSACCRPFVITGSAHTTR
jgi:hypothetical protein